MRPRRFARVTPPACVLILMAAFATPAIAAKTERVSVSSSDTQANGVSGSYGAEGASISADGRFVAFTSKATNLVPHGPDNGREPDIFLRDRKRHRTVLVSHTPSGRQANGPSSQPSVSADGHFIAFESQASNLTRHDANKHEDVFVYSARTGRVTLVSLSRQGRAGNGESRFPSISADGRFVAFDSAASDLVRGDSGHGTDVFVRDTKRHTTRLVSLSSTRQQGNGASRTASISATGRFIAFVSSASNLTPGDDNDTLDVFVRDLRNGKKDLVSETPSGQSGNDLSVHPRISAHGRLVAFDSDADNLVPSDTNFRPDAFVRDRKRHRTELVSKSSSGEQGRGISGIVDISASGRYVAFFTYSRNLEPRLGGGKVLLRDRRAHSTVPVSLGPHRAAPFNSCYGDAISANGRFVVFHSQASNLVKDDTNGRTDVFVRGPLH
jgi:Tol biopolymer transport system component